MTAPYDPEHVTYFAETNFRNQQTRFGIKSRDRTRHMYVVGKSGVGKSTLLENMAIQDIQDGQGVAVLDPHGSFAEKMLDYIPQHRIKDVVYFAPFDLDHPVSFNMLEDVGADKRHFVASGLMSTFKKIWVDAWSARMEYILNNILLALLEYPDATLLGVNRMLSDKDFRKKVVANISDPSVKSFWTDEFEKYGERYMQEAGAAIQNKIGQFTANPLVRNIVGQPKSSFDVRDIMDNQKILIVNLSKGRIGEQNTSLLGSMIITKIYIAAMSRADVSYARMTDLPSFYFYVDEFQSFANESFANILSEARKYKLALIIAHQYIAQMEEPVRDAVFGNVGTSLSFRVGPLDAEILEKVYSPQFTANDLINLGMAQVYLSLMINDIGSQPFSAKTIAPIPRPDISYRNDVIEWTREHFAKPKELVENNIREWFGKDAAIANGLSQDSDKKFKFNNDRKPVTSYQQGQTYTPKTFSQEKPREQIKDEPKEHTPFKQALQSVVKEEPSITPVIKTEEVVEQKPIIKVSVDQPIIKTVKPQPFIKKTFIPKQNVEPKFSEVQKPTSVNTYIKEPEINTSSKLSVLLDSLDGSKTKVTEIPIKETTRAPFVGEKTLRETISPVKHAERGATEQSRNLLKEALMKATMNSSEKNIKTNFDDQKKSVVSQPQTINQSQPDQTKSEISHQELQKILE